MFEKLDSKDKQILYQLDLNARQSFREIGKKVKLSKEVVNYRIKRMENEGIIKGYYTLINMSRLGYMMNRLFVKFRNLNPEKEKDIVNFYCKNKKYWWIVSANNFIDLGIGTWEKGLEGFKTAREELISNFGSYLQHFDHALYLGFYIYRRAYLNNKKSNSIEPINYIVNKEESIDELDFKLLKLISDNARLPTINIAKKLDVNVQTVSQRMKKLLDVKIIETFRPIIDLSKIGYYWYKVVFTLKDYSTKKEMLNYCASNPNIIYAYETTTYDLEIELEVKNYDQFKDILDDFRTKFDNAIESYNHLVWYKENKVKFFME